MIHWPSDTREADVTVQGLIEKCVLIAFRDEEVIFELDVWLSIVEQVSRQIEMGS